MNDPFRNGIKSELKGTFSLLQQCFIELPPKPLQSTYLSIAVADLQPRTNGLIVF